MVLLNMASVWHIPKSITNDLTNPKVVANANFSVSLGWIGICQYPLAKSRVEKIFAIANLSNKVCALGSGSASIFCYSIQFLEIDTKSRFFSSFLST